MKRSTWWPEGDGVESKVIRGVVVYRRLCGGCGKVGMLYYTKRWYNCEPRTQIVHTNLFGASASKLADRRRNCPEYVV